MTHDQLLLLSIGILTIFMFIKGRWRHDLVAMGSLLACVLTGLVPAAAAFSGFGHPAVITVACVLMLSRGLQLTGAVDVLAQRVLPTSAGPTLSIASITGLGAILSAFMNNVGAMALLMPVAISLAAKQNLPPGKILMPLAFGTILGGMTTLIGTPPNLIVSGFRNEIGAGSFAMFDFTPVGLTVALLGVGFAALVGWRLVPTRQQGGGTTFETGTYLTEARLVEGGKAEGMSLREIERALEEVDAQIIGMVRNAFRVFAPNPGRILRSGDILVIEADPNALATVLSGLGLKLVGEGPNSAVDRKAETEPATKGKSAEEKGVAAKPAEPDENELLELVVMPTSGLIGRSVKDVHLRTRFGLNLLAISRQGRSSIKRLRSTAIQAGDVLLLQGAAEALSGFAATYGCVPLAKRSIRIPDKKKALTASAIMLLALAGAAFGLLPAAISFALGGLLFAVLRVVPLRRIYEAVDWPVIVLLGALFPVAEAMGSTGSADLLARFFLQWGGAGHPIAALAVILIVTMTLSDFMNNAATAAVMCPIAISLALRLGVNADTFLMAVAVGSSCAFLTPIGHQNNTLILGPGGFRFGDYWRLGLPMEILVVAVSLPMLLLVWPL